MPHVRAADAPSFQLPGLAVTSLASPSLGASLNCVWRLRVPADTRGTPHSMNREEIFVALSGNATATVGEESHQLQAGDALIIPSGATFSLANPGSEDFEAVAMAPVGMQVLLDGAEFSPPWLR